MVEGKEIIPVNKRKSKKEKGTDPEIAIPHEIIEKAGSKEAALKLILKHSESFSGPIPHPKIFAQYKEVMSDAPKRIFKMAELQQKHRFQMESSVIQGDVRRADAGLRFGFILFGVIIIGGIGLVWIGKDIQGGIILSSGFIGGIVNFIRVGREREKQIQPPTPSKKTTKRKKTKKTGS